MLDKDIELKPCPFCGHKGELKYSEKTGKYVVTCTNALCRCRTGLDFRIKAIGRWNRRAD